MYLSKLGQRNGDDHNSVTYSDLAGKMIGGDFKIWLQLTNFREIDKGEKDMKLYVRPSRSKLRWLNSHISRNCGILAIITTFLQKFP